MPFKPFSKKTQTASNPKAKPAKASPIQKVAAKAAAMPPPAMPMMKGKAAAKPMPFKNGGKVGKKAC